MCVSAQSNANMKMHNVWSTIYIKCEHERVSYKKLPGNSAATVVLDQLHPFQATAVVVVSHSRRNEWPTFAIHTLLCKSCAKPIVMCTSVNPAIQPPPLIVNLQVNASRVVSYSAVSG